MGVGEGKPIRIISGVKVKSLKVIPDERGRLMEILRSDERIFQRFGQCYMTTAKENVVKGWHYHQKQTDNFACVSGMAKLVCYDGRKGSRTHGEINEFFIGVHNPILVQIPPGVYHGFKGVSNPEAILINVPTLPYNHKKPDEYRLPPHGSEIPYDWNSVDR